MKHFSADDVLKGRSFGAAVLGADAVLKVWRCSAALLSF